MKQRDIINEIHDALVLHGPMEPASYVKLLVTYLALQNRDGTLTRDRERKLNTQARQFIADLESNSRQKPVQP